MPLPLDPPLNVQMVFSHVKTDKPLVQVGLSTAMEQMELPMDLPAHRALNDAIYTAKVMAKLQKDVEEAPQEIIEALLKFNREEAASALSDTRSVPTGCTKYDDVLDDPKLVAVRCPICGGEQYRWDRAALWHGRRVCLPCLARLEEEEETNL